MKALLTVLAIAVCILWAWTAQGQEGGLLDDLTRPAAGEARRTSSSNADLSKNGDAKSIAPGETLEVADLTGPGAITHIWCTVGMDDPFYGRSLVIRIYWDGAEQPSVEAPLGDFFGVGHGAEADFSSLPVSTSANGRARNCFWRMPFEKSARITVSNDSETYPCRSFYFYVDWQQMDAPPEETPYFHAQYRQAMPAPPGNYTLLDTQGRGHYVGVVYSAQMVEIGWFGEGDDFFYIDGEETPSLRGTGTEDYFGDAWGFRQFARPYYGVTLWEGYFPGDRVTAYRWHIADPIPFQKSLRVEIEHKGSIYTDTAEYLGQFYERPDWLSSVAFWYQTPAAVLERNYLPDVSERVAPYRVIPGADLAARKDPPGMDAGESSVLSYLPMTESGRVEVDFEIETAGRYQVNAVMRKSVAGGVYQPYFDGRKMGLPIDFCVSGEEKAWIRLDLQDLKPGVHTLAFEGAGPSPHLRAFAPPMHGLAMDYLILLRLEDMAGYQETLKRITTEDGQKK